jgi:hypothetical protein
VRGGAERSAASLHTAVAGGSAGAGPAQARAFVHAQRQRVAESLAPPQRPAGGRATGARGRWAFRGEASDRRAVLSLLARLPIMLRGHGISRIVAGNCKNTEEPSDAIFNPPSDRCRRIGAGRRVSPGRDGHGASRTGRRRRFCSRLEFGDGGSLEQSPEWG